MSSLAESEEINRLRAQLAPARTVQNTQATQKNKLQGVGICYLLRVALVLVVCFATTIAECNLYSGYIARFSIYFELLVFSYIFHDQGFTIRNQQTMSVSLK